jgi:hypothetical protein
MVLVLIAIGLACVVLFGVLGLWLLARRDQRGYTDAEYERDREGGTAVGNAFLAVQSIFEPDKKHAVEVRQADLAEDVGSGAPPEPGPS